MEQALLDCLGWLEPRALLFAILLPPLIRISGHWIPEGLFMVAIGVMAARCDTLAQAVTLLGAVTLSHFVTDQCVHAAGRWIRPRLDRFKWAKKHLGQVCQRLESSPSAIWGLVPARVLPSGRVAWLLGSGVAAVPWPRFAVVDAVALVVHTIAWSGLGWWVAGDMSRLAQSVEFGKVAAVWALALAVGITMAVMIWRRRTVLQVGTVAAVRRLRPRR